MARELWFWNHANLEYLFKQWNMSQASPPSLGWGFELLIAPWCIGNISPISYQSPWHYHLPITRYFWSHLDAPPLNHQPPPNWSRLTPTDPDWPPGKHTPTHPVGPLGSPNTLHFNKVFHLGRKMVKVDVIGNNPFFFGKGGGPWSPRKALVNLGFWKTKNHCQLERCFFGADILDEQKN